MIIHTLSRKKPAAFGVIVDYLERGRPEAEPARCFNMWADPENLQEVKDEFLENYTLHHSKQRGRIVLMHEIISPDPEDAEKVNAEILFDIAEKYLEGRAPESMAQLVYHEKLDGQSRPQPHVHILLSGNRIGSSKSVRLSKKEYAQVRHGIAQYAHERYGLSQAYEKELEGHRKEFTKEKAERKRREIGLINRDPSLSKKEQTQVIFKTLITESRDKALFDQAMRENGFAWNRTGKNPSVIDINTGKKYRLSTLGVLEDYERYSQEWEQTAERVRQRQEEAEMVYEAYQEETRAHEASREVRQEEAREEDSVAQKFKEEAERISQILPKDRTEYEKRRLQTWLMLQHLEEQRGQERSQEK